jgi:hypothetical protein
MTTDERLDGRYKAILDLAREREMSAPELALVCLVIAGGFVGKNHSREDWDNAIAEASQAMREAADAQSPRH